MTCRQTGLQFSHTHYRLPHFKKIAHEMYSLCASSYVLKSIFVLLNVNPEAHISELQLRLPHPRNWTLRLKRVQQTRLHGRWQLTSNKAQLWLTWTKPHSIDCLNSFLPKDVNPGKTPRQMWTTTAELVSVSCIYWLRRRTMMSPWVKSAEHTCVTVSSFCRPVVPRQPKKTFVSGAGATRHHIITGPQRGQVIISQ